MSSPTLAVSAAAAAILLAAVGLAAPRDDGARSVRSLAHEEQLPRAVPTGRVLLAAAPGGEPLRKRGAGTGAHYPALADSPKMKG